MVGSASNQERMSLSGNLELLATSLAGRHLSLDVGVAECEALRAAIKAAKSEKAFLVIAGAVDSPDYAECLAGVPDWQPIHAGITPAPGAFKLRGEVGFVWQALLARLAARTAWPIVLFALALESEEVTFLRSQVAGRLDVWAITVLGEVATDDMRSSHFTRSWIVWTRQLPPDFPAPLRKAYKSRLGIPDTISFESRLPITAKVEVVSLRTAAQASSGKYWHSREADAIFDMHDRIYKSEMRPFEHAIFDEAVVFPSSSWKVLIEGRLYVEEVGYVEHERPHLIESWPEFGARWTIRASGPAFEVCGDDRFTLLLGGDVAHYHLLLNWLPRLRAFDNPDLMLLLGETPRIAVSARFSQKEKDLTRRLVGRDVEFTMVPEAGTYRFTNLIVPSFFSHHELTPAVANWYRRRLEIGPIANARRIYISRADSRAVGTPRRKVVNEAEVIAALRPLGFEPIELGSLAMADQISLFANAEFVVGPHGAGFANMVFTPAGAGAIVLENSWAHDFISDMLNVSGHRASILVCEDHFSDTYEAQLRSLGLPDTEIRRSRDMIVDCKALIKAVKMATS